MIINMHGALLLRATVCVIYVDHGQCVNFKPKIVCGRRTLYDEIMCGNCHGLCGNASRHTKIFLKNFVMYKKK